MLEEAMAMGSHESAAKLVEELKQCSCGRRYTLGAYRCLPLKGYAGTVDVKCEMRDCPCGNTMGITLVKDGGVVLNG